MSSMIFFFKIFMVFLAIWTEKMKNLCLVLLEEDIDLMSTLVKSHIVVIVMYSLARRTARHL
jgi:hypothetical protein